MIKLIMIAIMILSSKDKTILTILRFVIIIIIMNIISIMTESIPLIIETLKVITFKIAISETRADTILLSKILIEMMSVSVTSYERFKLRHYLLPSQLIPIYISEPFMINNMFTAIISQPILLFLNQ